MSAVEWEDLDPDKYRKLFEQTIKHVHFLREDSVSEKSFTWYRNSVKTRASVFRRAKLTLVGNPLRESSNASRQNDPVAVQIVQYGPNMLDRNNPTLAFRCKEDSVGRPTNELPGLHYLLVSGDLNVLYQSLIAMRGAPSNEILFRIDEALYLDRVFSDGMVQLAELTTHPFVAVDPVCRFVLKHESN